MIKCSNCGTENLEEAVFCKECGTKLHADNEAANVIEDEIKCCRCNTVNPKASTFCKNCGMKFDGEDAINVISSNKEETSNDNNRKIDYKLWCPIILGLVALIVIICLFVNTNKETSKDSREFETIEEPKEKIVEEHIHSYVLEPISTTKHKIVCNIEGCNYYEEKECTFIDNICECGNEIVEEQEIIEEKDDKQDLLDKMSGVWGYKSNYFLYFDGGDGFTHGWFESDRLPYNHITTCKKVSDNIYEVELFVDAAAGDDEYGGSDSYAWKAILDGSYDGFKTLLKMIDEEGQESYFVYLSDNYENALEECNYDFDIISQKYSQKLEEFYMAEGIVIDDETICGLAREYYKKMNGEAPPLVSIDSRNGNEIRIHLYEIMEYDDYPEENHASTWGWYYIDANTLEGTDFFGMPVNLNEVR